MLFPQNIEDKLGFDKIRNIVSTECKTKSGQRALEKLHFSTDQEYLSSERKKFTEMASLMSEDLPFPMIAFEDVTALLQQAKVEGIQLAEADFFEIRKIMLTSSEIVSFFKKYGSETYGSIFNLADELFADEHFTKELVRIIDETGKVSDFASPELKQIRKSLNNLKNGVRQRLEDMLRHNHKEGITDEQHQITVRDGRLVIPVKAEYKRQLKSIIHDESASGQTAFVEPIEVVENNNRIRELELDEKREIIRLLMHLAEMLRHNLDEVIRNVEVLGEFDLIQAKLRFAGRIEGNLPLISKDKKLVLRNAFHPILLLNNALSGKTIVPFSIELDNEKRILRVSGPNAGGKSVALKALGLLQYMFQCGKSDARCGPSHACSR